MDNKNSLVPVVVFAVLTAAGLLAGAYLIPWKNTQWGRVELQPSSTITVIGEADSQVKSQIASFNAGVSAINDNKDTAVAEVNQKVNAITTAVKTFGIPAEDIQTQNLSIYQNEEQYYEDGRQKTRAGQWRVNNSIDIKLRDVNRASELANLLSSSGATNVYGPNFTLDDTQAAETELLDLAVQNARQKAEKIAASSSRSLGKTISVTEGGAATPPILYGRMEAGGGGGADLQPGSGTVSKTVTVTFELN